MPFFAAAGEIMDIKPPAYFKTDYLPFLIAAIIVLLAGLIIAGIYLFRKRRKGKDEPPVVIKPAHKIAYEAMEALKEKDLPSRGMIKEYYFGLSGIVRRYMENRFSFRAPEMTTEEFLSALKNSEALGGKCKNLIKDFLILCDTVKFAKYGPTKDEIAESFDAAWRLVDETKEEDAERLTA